MKRRRKRKSPKLSDAEREMNRRALANLEAELIRRRDDLGKLPPGRETRAVLGALEERISILDAAAKRNGSEG